MTSRFTSFEMLVISLIAVAICLIVAQNIQFYQHNTVLKRGVMFYPIGVGIWGVYRHDASGTCYMIEPISDEDDKKTTVPCAEWE